MQWELWWSDLLPHDQKSLGLYNKLKDMELTIKIDDNKIYTSLILFLKSVGIKIISEKKTAKKSSTSGSLMAVALEKIARSGGIKNIKDPSDWQRKTREDRKF